MIGTSEKAENAFIKFTDILKYTYVTIEKELVPLGEEIEYIQNYIDLQMLRLNSHTKVNWSHDVDDDNIMVPPMLMLTFVENAFKYGTSASKDCSVTIKVCLKAGCLEFETHNSIMKHADQFRKDVPVGIENCRARLNGLFPARHELVTSESDGIYNVYLKIQMK